MAYLSLSQSFLVPVPKLAVRLEPASPLSPPFSPPPQHLASLQPTIILALMILREVTFLTSYMFPSSSAPLIMAHRL